MTDVMRPDADDELGLGAFGELGVKLELHLGRQSDQLARIAKRLNRPPAQPVDYPVVSTVTIANTVGVVDLGSPDQGHFWYVRSLRVLGLTPSTAAAGTADVFVLPVNTASVALGAGGADWRDRAAALPKATFYGRGELRVEAEEHLMIVFRGATNGQDYLAAANVEDIEDAADRQGFAL